jgi:hypothetical protein
MLFPGPLLLTTPLALEVSPCTPKSCCFPIALFTNISFDFLQLPATLLLPCTASRTAWKPRRAGKPKGTPRRTTAGIYPASSITELCRCGESYMQEGNFDVRLGACVRKALFCTAPAPSIVEHRVDGRFCYNVELCVIYRWNQF